MEAVAKGLSAFFDLSMDHVNALIALGGLSVAVFALYVVLVVIKELRQR